MRRHWAAAEARAYGWGGIQAVSTAIGMSATTIRRGLGELSEQEAHPSAEISRRIRLEGGGRKWQTELDPGLSSALEYLIEPATRGDPESPLRWTCKSTTQLARELTAQGHPVSPSTVWRLLSAVGYSLQSNRKTKEGTDHPDRNEQFEYIAAMVQDFQQRGQPIISVDTKKKELIGEFRMAPGHPLPVFTTDGLQLYFYALTAHFGHWITSAGSRKRVW
jgi:transposase